MAIRALALSCHEFLAARRSQTVVCVQLHPQQMTLRCEQRHAVAVDDERSHGGICR